eukprot:scaffold12089_cov176-Ochromonas_danica.AAC.10
MQLVLAAAGLFWLLPLHYPSHAHLNAVRVVAHLEGPRGDELQHLHSRLDEGFLHVLSHLRTSLQKDQTVTIGVGLPLCGADRSLVLEVLLVAHKGDDQVGVGVLSGLFKPSIQVLEGVSARDVVHEKCTTGAAVVAARYAAEGLLPRLGTPATGSVESDKDTQNDALTVSHICSLINLPSMSMVRDPNSTPIVMSWTCWKRLSVNCKRKQLFPTQVSPMIINLNK